MGKTFIGCVLCAAMVLAASPRAEASEGDYGTEGIFSLYGAGARSDALGNAFTAVGGDLSSIMYNPAGLAGLPRQRISMLYYPLYEDMYYGMAAYGAPLLDVGTIAAAFYDFYGGKSAGYDPADVYTWDISAGAYRATVSYAKRFNKYFSAGAGANIFVLNEAGFNSTAFSLDAGVMLEPLDFLRVGAVVNNALKPAFSMRSGTEILPQRYTLGAALKYPSDAFTAMISGDLILGEKEALKYRAGAEAGWPGAFCLRAGYDDGQLSFGAGLGLAGIVFDYAFTINQYLGSMHRFTLSLDFGLTTEEQRAEKKKAVMEEVRKLVDGKITEQSYMAAVAGFKRGNYSLAMEKFRDVEAVSPDYRNTRMFLKDIEKSIGISESSKKSFNAGVELYMKGRYPDALKELNNALKGDRNNPTIKDYIAKAKLRAGAPKETGDIERLYYKGVDAYAAGDLEKAVSFWEKIAEIDPSNIRAQKDMARARAELEELRKRGIK